MALALCEATDVSLVRVFSQRGARVPAGLENAKLVVEGTWIHDAPLSILLNCLGMLRAARSLDHFLGNLYVTSFGRNPLANAVGLLSPVFVAKISRVPFTVYVHNFAETQDVKVLGYHPSVLTRWAVKNLERALLKSVEVVVPLKSQARTVKSTFGMRVRTLALPYIDVLASAMRAEHPAGATDGGGLPNAPTVLLFGNWGPQKDLEGAIKILDTARSRGAIFNVIVAGGANRNFPEYAKLLHDLSQRKSPEGYEFIGPVAEEGVFSLIHQADLILLPYRATGGYSGALNCAALTDTPVVAFDLPQLREFAGDLQLPVTFIDQEDVESSARVISDSLLNAARQKPPIEPDAMRTRLTACFRAARSLISSA